MKTGVVFFVLMVLACASVSAQQAVSTPAPNALSTAEFALTPLPASVKLEGLRPVYQQLNRCATAALTIQMSYFGFAGTYDQVIQVVNPNIEDVATRLTEMASYANSQGLSAAIRYGGTIDLLKALVAHGFPVLVENVYYDGVTGDAFRDFTSHNRVIMGYDDALGVLYSFDSLLGNGEDGTGRPIPYEDYDNRWRPFNRGYMVLYRPQDEARVQTILGDQWDITANLEHALALSQQEIDDDRADSFTLFNMGETLVLLGRFEEAAANFDQARTIGLPWRMFWYQYGALDAYLAVGRYDDVLAVVRQVLDGTPGVEEVYYYAALAYEAQGDLARAESNLEVALFRNINFSQATQVLIRVRAAMGG
jgi:tetratricopeptide (TPR) repeat protein